MAASRRTGRLAVLGMIGAMLVLTGCGRRGALEPAPNPNKPFALGTPAPVKNERTGLPERKKNPAIVPPKEPFILDPLL